MKDDVVERLRAKERDWKAAYLNDASITFRAAADEIERLRREVERLNTRTLTRPWGD